MEYITYSLANSRIDKGIIKALEVEVQYWYKVLQRELSFRGTNEVVGSQNNGNFLGIIELIAEYDSFLKEHIKLYANKGRGNVS